MAERQTATGRAKSDLTLETQLEQGSAGGPPSSPARDRADLSLCPCCRRDLVYPIDWTPAGRGDWSVTLRCPECEWRGGGIYTQDQVDRFDEALDDGVQALMDDLELLTRANAEAEIERFAAALQADLILPEDF